MESPLTIDVMLANDPGKCIAIPYTIDEPVYLLAERVAMQLKENKKDYHWQELYLAGFHLEYPQLPLANYCILGGTLTYQSIKKGEMSVFVKNLNCGKTLCISCDPSDTILAIKKVLFKREGVPLGHLQLQYQGKVLEDDDTLEDRGVSSGSTLNMSTRVRGGLSLTLSAPVKFADVSDRSGIRTVALIYNGLSERTVHPGTNIEITCPCNPKFGMTSPIHFGTVEISQERFTCPKCKASNKTIATSVGFRTCKYRFHGLKADGTQLTAGWTNVQKEDQYQLFDPKKQIGWTRLVIESAPLDGEDNCPLCTEQMFNGVETLTCGHRFHRACQTRRGSATCSSGEFQKCLIRGRKFMGALSLRFSQ